MNVIDRVTGEHYDLPLGAKISVTETQPLLTTQGSISMQTALSYTDKNNRLLDFPHRYDRNRKYITKREVIIQAGSFQRIASMVVTSAQKLQPIKVTFLFDEGEINNRIKDVTMEKVFSTIVRDPYTGTAAKKAGEWIDYFDAVMCGDTEDDFRIFPICTKYALERDFINHVCVRTDNGIWSEETKKSTTDGKEFFRLSAYQV